MYLLVDPSPAPPERRVRHGLVQGDSECSGAMTKRRRDHAPCGLSILIDWQRLGLPNMYSKRTQTEESHRLHVSCII